MDSLFLGYLVTHILGYLSDTLACYYLSRYLYSCF